MTSRIAGRQDPYMRPNEITHPCKITAGPGDRGEISAGTGDHHLHHQPHIA